MTVVRLAGGRGFRAGFFPRLITCVAGRGWGDACFCCAFVPRGVVSAVGVEVGVPGLYPATRSEKTR